MFSIPADLAPQCAPLAWLLGRWEGSGVGGYPTIDDFSFAQEVSFEQNGKPFLSYRSRAWLRKNPRNGAADSQTSNKTSQPTMSGVRIFEIERKMLSMTSKSHVGAAGLSPSYPPLLMQAQPSSCLRMTSLTPEATFVDSSTRTFPARRERSEHHGHDRGERRAREEAAA